MEILKNILDLIKIPESIPFVLIGFICWLLYKIYILKKDERKQKHENFLNIISIFSKFVNNTIHVTELLCSIYQLQYLKEYSKTTIPVLIYFKERFSLNELNKDFIEIDKKSIIEAMDYVLQELGANKTLKQVQGDVKEKERNECKQ